MKLCCCSNSCLNSINASHFLHFYTSGTGRVRLRCILRIVTTHQQDFLYWLSFIVSITTPNENSRPCPPVNYSNTACSSSSTVNVHYDWLLSSQSLLHQALDPHGPEQDKPPRNGWMDACMFYSMFYLICRYSRPTVTKTMIGVMMTWTQWQPRPSMSWRRELRSWICFQLSWRKVNTQTDTHTHKHTRQQWLSHSDKPLV